MHFSEQEVCASGEPPTSVIFVPGSGRNLDMSSITNDSKIFFFYADHWWDLIL